MGIGFVVGVLVTLGSVGVVLATASVVERRRFRSKPLTFACRIRVATGGRRRRWRRWPLRGTRARWMHDVLLLQSGLGLSVRPVAARIAPGAVLRPLPASDVRGLGRRPCALLFSVEGGGALDIAVAGTDRALLVGPYLTAALSDLPTAPREKG